MIDDSCVVAYLILVDDGEGGRGDDLRDPQFLAYSLDERGLASAHLAVESEYRVLSDGLHKLACSIAYVFNVVDDDFHILMFFRVDYLFFPVMVMSGMSISSIEMPPCWNVSL